MVGKQSNSVVQNMHFIRYSRKYIARRINRISHEYFLDLRGARRPATSIRTSRKARRTTAPHLNILTPLPPAQAAILSVFAYINNPFYHVCRRRRL